STTIRVRRRGAAPVWVAAAFGLDPENAVEDAEWLPVWSEAGTLAHAVALRITRAASIDYVLFAEPAVRGAGEGPVQPTWGVAEFETDACALFVRVGADHAVARVAMVDGSTMRSGGSGRRAVQIVLPQRVSDLHVDALELGMEREASAERDG